MSETVAIVGGGIIGGGWAARFLLNGWEVRIFDPDPQSERKIGEVLENARRSLPGLSDVEMPSPGRIRFCEKIEDTVLNASFIIEAVPERLEIKQSVYKQIENKNSRSIIASSTSGIMPSDLQSKMKYPERLIVAHPFNPVYLLPLVELVGGSKTDDKFIATARELLIGLGMHPLHCRVEIEGFLSDRLQEALWREALWLLKDNVATAEELDAAIAYGPGLRWAQMGTMQTFHLAGGEGGMRAMLAMFGPCLKWPWTKLMDVPELTPDFVEMVGDQCEIQSSQFSPRELEKIRDNNLVSIMRALKGQNWGAGRTLNEYDVRAKNTDRRIPDEPLNTGCRVVPLDWTDYNGHMNEARYLQAFCDATDRFMVEIGCDENYIKTGGSYFTAETHIRHIEEVLAGSKIFIQTTCLESTKKKIHIFHEMIGEKGQLLASGEHLLLHVSLATRKVSEASEAIQEELENLSKEQANIPTPGGVGRHVGQPK
jgi:carnitine 3-dehydrogenase